jgi:molybdenum cofactor guanylyltransferase
MPNLLEVTGLILAGGQGSRMGSVDKGLAVLNGKTMVAHVLERLAPQVGGIMINANRSLDVYAALGYVVVPDQLTGYAGPLAGLQAGFALCDTPFLLSAACDTPFLPLDLVPRLLAALLAQNADCAVAQTTENGQIQTHPVIALYRREMLASLNTFLATGQRKIDKWTAQHRVASVDFAEPQAFANINTLAELNLSHDQP